MEGCHRTVTGPFMCSARSHGRRLEITSAHAPAGSELTLLNK
jgi:hypothetical protein